MIFKQHLFHFKIILTPEELTKDFESILLQKVKDEYEGKAVENYGIIKIVEKIIKIEEERIMDPIPNVLFKIKVVVKSYIPMKDDIIIMKIEKIIPYGIFLQMDSFRVLIPISNLDENVRIDVGKSAIILKENQEFKKDMDLQIQLQEIRYEKNGYNCLAKVYYE